MPTYCGIVEGFYWREKHTIAGRYAEFDREKRKRLLELMAGKGLNIYVYDPKVLRGENCERAYSPQLVGNRRDWEDTFGVASQNGIAFVWGLAPGRHEHWHGKLKHLQETVDRSSPPWMIAWMRVSTSWSQGVKCGLHPFRPLISHGTRATESRLCGTTGWHTIPATLRS